MLQLLVGGWGAADGRKKIFGFWSTVEQKFHIIFLELLTVKLALEALAEAVTDCQILIRIDNTTALSYINNMGGIRVDSFSK